MIFKLINIFPFFQHRKLPSLRFYYIHFRPSSSTPQKDIEDAMKFIKLIGGENKYTIVNIDEVVKNFVDKVNTTDKIIKGI
ncbi:MAG: hypothetical protein RXO22_09295 [Thermocladium sp.]